MSAATARAVGASTFAYVLAFNGVFFVQELFLVLPKAFTPGLSPTLFHNDHDWTGHHPLENLLQGTGALATVVFGLIALRWSARHREASPNKRLVAAWIALQGFFQALQQVVLAAFIPGNDVGRAFAWLGLGDPTKDALAIAAVVAMVLVARRTVGAFVPAASTSPMRSTFVFATVPALLGTILVLPYRVPGPWIEVAFVPALVAFDAIVCLQLAAAAPTARRSASFTDARPLSLVVACVALLLAFQVVLRPGIRFF